MYPWISCHPRVLRDVQQDHVQAMLMIFFAIQHIYLLTYNIFLAFTSYATMPSLTELPNYLKTLDNIINMATHFPLIQARCSSSWRGTCKNRTMVAFATQCLWFDGWPCCATFETCIQHSSQALLSLSLPQSHHKYGTLEIYSSHIHYIPRSYILFVVGLVVTL